MKTFLIVVGAIIFMMLFGKLILTVLLALFFGLLAILSAPFIWLFGMI